MSCERCFQADLPEPKSFRQKLDFRMSARPGFKKELVAQSMAGPGREAVQPVQSFKFEPVMSSPV